MNQSIQKRPETATGLAVGTFRNAQQVNQLMERAYREAILVSPATSVGAMPEGCGIALTKISVDISVDNKGKFLSDDTYDVGGKRGLSKTVLQKIGAGLGVSWDPVGSGRVDNGADPYYCHWRAVGSYRSFDGQVQTIIGEKEMDLREGSAQVQALWDRYESKKALAERKNWELPKPPTDQIREQRLHIMAHAETKAQLRAIRSLGLKTSYPVEELRKPFVCARVMWTGQTDDPELKRIFAEKQADAFLGGTRSLYGRGSESLAPNRSGPAPLRLSGAPPLGSVPFDEDDVADMGEVGGSAQATQSQAQPTAQQPAQQATAPETQAKPAGGQRRAPANANGPTLPAGDSKDLPLNEAHQKDLVYWSNRLERDIEEGNSRNPQKDQALLDAVNGELARRAEQGPQQELGGGKY